MSRISEIVKFIENIPKKNIDLLKEICSQLKKVIKEDRPIMYFDIINIIIRKQFYGERYNHLIVWCNYHIRKGNYFFDF